MSRRVGREGEQKIKRVSLLLPPTTTTYSRYLHRGIGYFERESDSKREREKGLEVNQPVWWSFIQCNILHSVLNIQKIYSLLVLPTTTVLLSKKTRQSRIIQIYLLFFWAQEVTPLDLPSQRGWSKKTPPPPSPSHFVTYPKFLIPSQPPPPSFLVHCGGGGWKAQRRKWCWWGRFLVRLIEFDNLSVGSNCMFSNVYIDFLLLMY